MLRPSGAESELYCLFGQRFGSGAYLSKGSTGESLCFLLCGQFEFGEPGTHEGIEPGENLLHVRYVDPVAVVFGQYFCEICFEFFRSLLVADGWLSLRMFVNFGENLCERDVLALGEMDISVSALTLELLAAFMRLPSDNDSTMTPRDDCATYLYKPGWPEMARISFNSIIFSVR